MQAPIRKGQFIEKGGIMTYRLPFPGNIVAALSTRGGGTSSDEYCSLNVGITTGDDPESVDENRRRLLDSLSISKDRLAIPQQTHSSNVKRVFEPGHYEDCDALITDVPNLFLTLSVADCCPIFAYDGARSAVGIAHAGWSGTQHAIAQRLIDEFASSFGSDPSDLLVALGPSIGPCCYKVGDDLREVFDPSLFRQSGVEHYLDLWEANRRQLVAAGLKASSIFVSRVCTSCGPELFFSHRRDRGRTGRMMAVIGMRADEARD